MFKRVLVGLAVGLAVGLCAGAVMAASDLTNTCTGTFEVTGLGPVASGTDSAVGRLQTSPYGPVMGVGVTISKAILNVRTGVSSNTSVPILSGDTVEYTITWANDAEAAADTMTLTDYVPAGMTFITGSETFTSAHNCSTPAIAEAGGMVTFSCTSAAGTDPGPKADGVFKFRATVN